MRTLFAGLGAWLALSVATAFAWSRLAKTLGGRRPALGAETRRRRRVMAGQAALLGGSGLGAALLDGRHAWDPPALVIVLAALALVSDAVPVQAGRFRLSGALVAMVLAMALCGPGPAVAIGVLCAAVDGIRSRPAAPYLLNNLAAYAAFPLAGALALQLVAGAPGAAFAVAVAAVAVLTNLLNFLLIAGHAAVLDRDPLLPALRHTWLPVLPWELATAAVTGATAYGFLAAGPGVVAVCALGLVALQVLLVVARRAPRLEPPPRVG